MAGGFDPAQTFYWLGLATAIDIPGVVKLPVAVVAAAVIGGVSLQGGHGAMLGALGGVLLLSTIDRGLNLMKVSGSWIKVIQGLIIRIAMFVDAQRLRYCNVGTQADDPAGDALPRAAVPSTEP